MANWKDVHAKCPFYLGESQKSHRIYCEGMGDAEKTIWEYRESDERQRIIQLEIFCQDCYTRCELYRALWEAKEE